MKILQVAACLVRVPTEIVKQRRQAGAGSHGLAIVRSTISSEVPTTTCFLLFVFLFRSIFCQGVLGLYRGYFTTLAREIPFSLIQFPLWEFLKKQLATVTGQVLGIHSPPLQNLDYQEAPMPWQASLCGAVAGGFSAAVTTPLDVAKTRIMLAKVVTPLGLS